MTTEVVQAEAPASEAAAVISAIERAAVNPAVDAERWQGFRDGEEFDGFCGLAGRAGAP